MGEIDGDIGIVYNMFGNKLTSGNNMPSTSPFSTFFEKYSCLFVLMPYMLQHYNCEDTINKFKAQLAQYR
jgi:hypothetical protein